MEMRICGNSDLQLSSLGLGCWSFGGGEYWGETNQQDVERVVHRAVELGINYFDTAEAYNEGRSEESLGQAIRDLPRESLVIGTKISPSNTRPDTLVAHCEASLNRLGTDYVDLYMVHWPIHPQSIKHFTDDEQIINNPPDERDAFETLASLQQQDKIRHVGVSNFAPSALNAAKSFGAKIIVNELPYSLLTRAIEWEVLPYCQDHGIGVIGYITLLQGLLADAYPTFDDIPSWQKRLRHFDHRRSDRVRHGEEGAEEQTRDALDQIRTIANRAGLTMAGLAIGWALAKKEITCALVGARSIAKLEANVRAASEPLPVDLVTELNEATRPLMEKLGPSFDYYESTANDRTVTPTRV